MVYRNYNKKKLFWFFLVPLIILGLVCFLFIFDSLPVVSNFKDGLENKISDNSSNFFKTGNLKINEQVINIEIAENNAQWFQGLSNRDNLCADCGMYFIFPTKDKLDFVMRDMKFPLDIIFIEDDKIINIAANLAPEGSDIKNIYSSLSKANRVLEVNAGYCQKYGIKAGDLVSASQGENNK